MIWLGQKILEKSCFFLGEKPLKHVMLRSENCCCKGKLESKVKNVFKGGKKISKVLAKKTRIWYGG
jgi:hypothetical protein